VKIALDPTPFHHDYDLLEFPRVVADLGYEYLQLTPHRDFIPFFNHPRADDDLVAKFRRACADAGVGIASVLPVLRWSGPDEDAREAAVRNWKRVVQITVDLGVNVINTEFSGRPERAGSPSGRSSGPWRNWCRYSSARASTFASIPIQMTSSRTVWRLCGSSAA
jgi:myo-inositol catabolism protein IolH